VVSVFFSPHCERKRECDDYTDSTNRPAEPQPMAFRRLRRRLATPAPRALVVDENRSPSRML
jgi:hypothetical protein